MKTRKDILKEIKRSFNASQQFFHTENNSTVLALNYKDPYEIIDGVLSQKGKLPVLSSEFIGALERFPVFAEKSKPFSVSVKFKNMSGFKISEFEEIIGKNIRFHIKKLRIFDKVEILTSIALLIFGAMLLALSYFANTKGARQIFLDILTIFGWVVIWESASRFILKRVEIGRRSRRLIELLEKGITVTVANDKSSQKD